MIDGVAGSENILKLWCNTFKQLYNSSVGSASTNLLENLDSAMSSEDIEQMFVSSTIVQQAIGKLCRGKSDGGPLVSDHVINAYQQSCKTLKHVYKHTYVANL